jgi:hypothetical protein
MFKMAILLVIAFVSTQAFAQAVPSSDPVLWNYSGAGGTQVITFVHDPIESWRGSVNIYDETSSEPWLTIQSPNRFDLFGAAKSSAGDIDGDGFDDIIIGAPLAGPNSVNPGRAHVYSGATGQELLQIPGFGKDDYFGRSVAGAGDTNGDGVPDILVAGWYHSERGTPYGRVYLLSGTDGKLLRTLTSYEAEDGFGYTITSLGDLNGDGVHEIAIAAPLAATSHLGTGSVYIFDLAKSPYKHITTSNALATIYNDSIDRDYFGSILAYDDQVSTSDFDAILIGSIDTVSYDINSAQFVFSHHKISGNQTDLGSTTVPGQLPGDAIPDGKVSTTDMSAATLSGGGIDVDGDGQVTVSDVALVISNFGALSPVQDLLSDPSPILSRMAELTTGGQLNVIPGDPQPWDGPGDCDDDDDDTDDDTDDDDDGPNTRPDVQPPYPGARPWDNCGVPPAPPCFSEPSDPPSDDDDSDDGCDDDDDDDDPDDDDSDPECNTCDEGDGGNCNAFRNFGGPRYVGRGLQSDQFYANMTSDDWVAQLQVTSESEVLSVSTQQEGPSGEDYGGTALFKNEADAGTRTLRWFAYNSQTGATVSKCFTVEVVDYESFTFKYRTFIPCEVIPNSIAGVYLPPHDYFDGDDRVFCPLNLTIFTPSFAKYRTSQTSFITPDGEIENGSAPTYMDCDEISDFLILQSNISTPFGPFGITSGYNNPGKVVPNPCTPIGGAAPSCLFALVPGAVPNNTGLLQLTTIPNWLFNQQILLCSLRPVLDGKINHLYQTRTGVNEVSLKYWLDASNPLVPGAPAINANIQITAVWNINKDTGRQSVACTVTGNADEFPAHEIYIENQPVNLYDPITVGASAVNLFDFWWDTPRAVAYTGTINID